MTAHPDAGLAPSDWVLRFGAELDQPGRVLDVACGTGRHARWFAQRGHRVTAVDADAAALRSLEVEPRVDLVCADLENSAWPLGSEKFSAVVVTNYLYRPLFPDLLRAVACGGVLIYETFARGNEQFGRPSNPAFLLRPGELLDVVRGELRVIAYEDVFRALPKPALIQRICARRESR